MNPFLILYIFLLLIFIGGVLAVLYHLISYRLNGTGTIVAIIFTFGAIIFLLISLTVAFQIEWSQLRLAF